MFKTYGIHTRLYYILKRICNHNRCLELNNLCNLFNISLEDAKKLNNYSNTRDFIKENVLLYTIGCIEAMEEKKEKDHKQFKETFAPMYSMTSALIDSFLDLNRIRR